MCGSWGGPTDPPIVRARVTEIQAGEVSTYHAWWGNEEERFSMVFPHRQAVEICFPYGSKAEEKLGRGHLLNVTVSELPTEQEKD